MGGKKKGAGGAKKGDGSEEDKYDPAMMTTMLAAQVQSLKERLSSEQERRDNSWATIEGIRIGEQEMLEKIESVKAETTEVVRKMTESYTELQENYLGKITKLNQEISNQREQIKNKQLQLMKNR